MSSSSRDSVSNDADSSSSHLSSPSDSNIDGVQDVPLASHRAEGDNKADDKQGPALDSDGDRHATKPRMSDNTVGGSTTGSSNSATSNACRLADALSELTVQHPTMSPSDIITKMGVEHPDIKSESVALSPEEWEAHNQQKSLPISCYIVETPDTYNADPKPDTQEDRSPASSDDGIKLVSSQDPQENPLSADEQREMIHAKVRSTASCHKTFGLREVAEEFATKRKDQYEAWKKVRKPHIARHAREKRANRLGVLTSDLEGEDFSDAEKLYLEAASIQQYRADIRRVHMTAGEREAERVEREAWERVFLRPRL